MNGTLKYVLIALIAFALGALASSKWFDNREPEIVVRRDTITIIEKDTTGLQIATKDKVEVEPVAITLPAGITTPEGVVLTEPVEVETKKYTGKEVLENGTIEFEIYADKLLAYDFKLTTEKEYIRETITKILPAKSRLYMFGGVEGGLFNNGIPQAAEVGLMYNRRQQWGIGLSIRQDFTGLLPQNKATTLGIRVYIGL